MGIALSTSYIIWVSFSCIMLIILSFYKDVTLPKSEVGRVMAVDKPDAGLIIQGIFYLVEKSQVRDFWLRTQGSHGGKQRCCKT